ncbi:hypothetical protein [Breznakiella homolactica]|uniref:Uncharacterized protein n=1 Tax=Breznakiella homolactica TaxID=2798577 RepID=A0A7T7XPE3_9SPIR|nr:hypothetical protein [Breznakiella homolactica]QQO09952.1 hypothetical protein JFL75_03295 [Breznakiella homolactica]
MENGKNLELLYQYASGYNFTAFAELFAELVSAVPAEELADAYMMRGQIKLFAADESFQKDLDTAGDIRGEPRFPCLNIQWQPGGPNRFVVFSKAPEALQRFSRTLPRGYEKLTSWYGEAGGGMVRQMQSEILYFSGNFSDAAVLSQEQYERNREQGTDALMSLYVLFRCYLATGAFEKAKLCMAEMAGIAEAHPDCIDSYEVIRDWVNLTTGWSGDTPRFHYVPNGESLPVLEDRLAAIRNGISRLGPSEEPFAEFARTSYPESYTMRQYYMDIFQSMHWLKVADHTQTEFYFLRAYHVAAASGLIMPFVEYGKQIIPLLQHIRSSGTDCPEDWISMILSLAEQYEKCLNVYRI